MNRFILVFFFFLSMKTVAQQSDFGILNIASTTENKFILFVDGVKINELPVSMIRLQRMEKLHYSIKIVFENQLVTPISRAKFFVCDQKGVKKEFTYKLFTFGKNVKLKFIKMTPPSPIASTIELSVYNLDEVNRTKSNVTETAAANLVRENETKSKLINKPSWNIKTPENWLCQNEWPMWKSDYQKLLENIKSEKNDAQKWEIAKKTVQKNCMTSEQIIELGSLINNESLKLEFVELSFVHTIDIKNYQRVGKIFKSVDAVDKLMKFVTE